MQRTSLRTAVLLAWAAAMSASCAETAPAPRLADRPRVRVLGTVQDGGLPHAACDCTRCVAAREAPRRVASLALVLPQPRRIYLFDATPDIREQLQALDDLRDAPAGRVDRAPLAGVFLTHAHMGHYLGLAFFGFEAVHTSGLPVHCTPALAGFLRDNAPWSQLVALGNIALEPLTAGVAVELGQGVRVSAFSVPHRDEFADTVGFRLDGPEHSLLYVPDTDGWERWNPPLEQRLQGIDVAILDGTFFSGDELPGRDTAAIGHPLIRESMARLAGVVREGRVQVFFTHLNHSNPLLDAVSPQRAELERAGFAVLAEGTEFPL